METARVDIRKLQLLNDRIGQCLDALAQVRLSVHGLSHTGSPTAGIGSGAGAPGQIPFGGFQGTSPFTPYYGGLSHSPFAQPFGPQQQQGGWWPQQQQQQGGSWPQQQGPYGLQQQVPFAPQQIPFNPLFAQTNSPQMQGSGMQIPGGMTGLSHTGSDIESLYARSLWADPVLAARVRETFPYVGQALSPFVSLF